MDELATWIMRETGAIRPKADVELKMAAGILNASANMPTEAQDWCCPATRGGSVWPPPAARRRRRDRTVQLSADPGDSRRIARFGDRQYGRAQPDPQTAAAGGALIARLFEEAGLPEGALHVLPGRRRIGEGHHRDFESVRCLTGSAAAGSTCSAPSGKPASSNKRAISAPPAAAVCGSG